MSKTYQKKTATPRNEAVVPPLETATVALTEIAESAREGLLALAVATGLQVMDAWMNADVEALCGPRGAHNPDRVGYRHSVADGSVTLGGRRVPVTRPRARAADGSGELPIPSYELFTGTELLGEMAMQRMLPSCPPAATGSGWSRSAPPWRPPRRPPASPPSPASSSPPPRPHSPS